MGQATPERRLVGRARELALLLHRLDGLKENHGALVLIEGEAGIGKTSLAQAFGERAQASGAVFAVGRCYEIGISRPFAPWHDLLDDLSASVSVEIATLPPPFGVGPPPQSAYHLMRAVVTVLHSTGRPLVLLLDDLHWADRDTLELVDFATRRLEQVPMLFLLTYRGEDLRRTAPLYDFLPHLTHDRPSDLLSLSELTPQAIADLVQALHGPCSPALATFLRERTDGNPFFLHELLLALVEQGALPRDESGQLLPPVRNVSIPPVLRQLIRHRVEQLGDNVVAMLEVAAVAGEEWDLRLVEALLAWPEQQLLDALEAATEGRIVVATDAESERYRFSHGLFREVLYDGQLTRRRRNLHRRIGELLAGSEDDDVLDAVAHHFWAAEDWGQALRYCLAAGDAARRRFAFHTAEALYEQALQAIEREGRAAGAEQRNEPGQEGGRAWSRIEVYERLGQTRTVLQHREMAEAAFEAMRQAAHTSGDAAAEGRALFWLSFVHTRLYQIGSARSTAEAALRVAEELGTPRLLALAHWTIGHVDKISGELESAEGHMLRAEELARASGSRDIQSWALLNLAQLALMRCDFRRAERLAREALSLGRESRDALGISGACWVLGWAQGELGLYEQAIHVFQSGIDHSRQSGDLHYQARLLNTMGWIISELGDGEMAARLNQESLTAARNAPGPRDRIAEAERYALLNLAGDALSSGDVDACRQRIEEFEQLLDRSEYARFRYLNRYQLLQAELALAVGNPAETLRWADEARALGASKGNRKNQARADMLAGRAWLALGKPHDALAFMTRADQLAGEIEQRALRWQARFWLGRVRSELGQSAGAVAAYQDAHREVEAIAAQLTDERLRGCFLASPLVRAVREAASGFPPLAPAAPATSPAGLTRREIEILRLVTQGATNAAIAQALSISVRTVDAHLTNIFTKTGCDNRAAAVAFALRHGLA